MQGGTKLVEQLESLFALPRVLIKLIGKRVQRIRLLLSQTLKGFTCKQCPQTLPNFHSSVEFMSLLAITLIKFLFSTSYTKTPQMPLDC